jgi:hypothetical protein
MSMTFDNFAAVRCQQQLYAFYKMLKPNVHKLHGASPYSLASVMRRGAEPPGLYAPPFSRCTIKYTTAQGCHFPLV